MIYRIAHIITPVLLRFFWLVISFDLTQLKANNISKKLVEGMVQGHPWLGCHSSRIPSQNENVYSRAPPQVCGRAWASIIIPGILLRVRIAKPDLSLRRSLGQHILSCYVPSSWRRNLCRSLCRFRPCTMVILFSTTHERFSQLWMKIKKVRQSVLSAILNLAGEVRLHFGGNATPFVQRGRIAQENSSMLHHSSGEHE